MVSLLSESWTWYAFALLVASVRYVSRYVQVGSLKEFQAEDFIMVGVLVFYTILTVCMNIVSELNTNLMLPGEVLDPNSIESRIRGSKLVLVVEQSMLLTIWGCKLCLLRMYSKLTFGLKQQLAVKIVLGYVIVTFVVMEILYLGVWCRPLNNYWKVPVENIQCSAAVNHLITNAVFNISSDIMMLCIPLPLLITSQLPRTKKFILCGLFGLGIFVILCAVLNKYYSFAQPFSPMWTFWYIREASTAILVANIPNCWPLMRKMFKFHSFHGTSPFTSRTRSNHITLSSKGLKRRKANTQINESNVANGTYRSQSNTPMRGADDYEAGSSWLNTGSQERIVQPAKALQQQGGPLEIWKSEVFEVDRASNVKGWETRTTTTVIGIDRDSNGGNDSR